MPQPLARLPSLTWEEVETIFDELSMTRRAAGSLSPLDLMREIFCIALVLPCGNDRPPKRPDREFHPPRSGG